MTSLRQVKREVSKENYLKLQEHCPAGRIEDFRLEEGEGGAQDGDS